MLVGGISMHRNDLSSMVMRRRKRRRVEGPPVSDSCSDSDVPELLMLLIRLAQHEVFLLKLEKIGISSTLLSC